MITECFVDGSFRKAGAAAGVIIYQNNKEVMRTVKPVITNNSIIPECEAILLAINLCFAADYKMPSIITDSQVLYEQFLRKRNIRSREVFFYVSTMWEMQKAYAFTIQFAKRDKLFVPDDLCAKYIAERASQFESRKF